MTTEAPEQLANQIANGDFETNTTGWSGVGGTETLTRITTDFKSGTACMQVTPTGLNGARTNPGIAVALNGVYTASAYVKGVVGNTLRLRVLRADLTTVLGFMTTPANGDWQRLVVSFTAPAAEAISVQVIEDTAGNALFKVDNVQLEPGSFPANQVLHGGDIVTLDSGLGGEIVVITGNLTSHSNLV